MFGDQLKFGDGVNTALSCAHANVEEKYMGLAIVRVLCTDCNQWVETKGRGGELVQTSSEESTNGSNVG